MSLQIGSLLLDRYRIKEILGHGGMSSVYMAIDENVNIPVAIKENLVLSENYSTQFKNEATILAGLRHPNLPRVSDYFYIPGQGQYLVMDFIEGEDLRERIEREGSLPEKDVIVIGLMICDALMYLHNLSPKVIHRDIKPGNIRITFNGSVALVDFGLVKVYQENQQTATGARAMTPGYSPPEQYGRGITDERSDIYSLGATLYAAITGIIPEDGLERLSGKVKLVSPKKLSSNISDALEKVILKAVNVDPLKRYQKAEEFYSALLNAGNYLITSKNTAVLSPPPSENLFPQIKTGTTQNLIRSQELSQPSEKTQRNKKWLYSLLILPLILSILFLTNFNGINKLIFQGERPFVAQIPIETTLSSTENGNSLTVTNSIDGQPTEQSTQIPELIAKITPTVLGGGEGQIAYASNDNDTEMQIWVMDIDGKNKQKLTELPDGACQPDWSPDGTKILFISPCSSKKETYEGTRILVLDTSANNEISSLPLPLDPTGDFDPVWSPDGNKIAFASYRPGIHPVSKEITTHIYVFNLENLELKEVTTSRWKDRNPAWSNEGNKIAFIRKIADNEVWIVNLENDETYAFSTRSGLNLLYPSWSHDDLILFYTIQNEISGSLPYFVGKRIEDVGLNSEFRIPSSGQQSFSPSVDASVSPDGQWLVFESWPDGSNHDIYIATINGTDLTKLTDNTSFEFGPDWRP